MGRAFFMHPLFCPWIIIVCTIVLMGVPASGSLGFADEEPVRQYTDEDLKRRKPPESGKGKPASEQQAPQSQTQPQSKEASESTRRGQASGDDWTRGWIHDHERRAYWEGQVKKAEAKVRELEQRLENLKRKKASIQNPLLPRVELTPEDREAEAGLDGAARLARVEAQIERAQRDLERARHSVLKAQAEAREALTPQSPFQGQ